MRPGARFSEVCTRIVHVFFENLSLLHIRRMHGENPGCTILGEVYLVGASNKTLISNNVNFRGVHRSCVRQGPRNAVKRLRGKALGDARGREGISSNERAERPSHRAQRPCGTTSVWHIVYDSLTSLRPKNVSTTSFNNARWHSEKVRPEKVILHR